MRDQILVSVKIGKHGPYTMIVDTALTPSMIDLETAREAGLWMLPIPVGTASGVGTEKVAVRPAWLGGLRIGEHAFDGSLALAMDTSSLSERLGRPLAGALGHGFLDGKIVQIDYPQRVIRFFPSDHWPPPREPDRPQSYYESSLEFAPGDIAPLLKDFRVNGISVPVTVDTGSSLAIELYPEAAAELGLNIDTEELESRTVVGTRGEATLFRTTVGRVAMGPLELSDVAADLARESRPPTERSGNLGNGILKHFVLTIDYHGGRIRLEQGEP